MKKIFIGLLIIAAGVGVYYFLQTQKTPAANSIQKELVTGKWRLSSLDVKTKDSSAYFLSLLSVIDSNLTRYQYDFKEDGYVFKSLGDTVSTDTSQYKWTAGNELAWKESATDSAGEIFTVTRLSADSLIMQAKDSAIFVFTRSR
ncbi:MAG: hypothetical protein WDO16_07625 [Bacteroidota bacterium]